MERDALSARNSLHPPHNNGVVPPTVSPEQGIQAPRSRLAGQRRKLAVREVELEIRRPGARPVLAVGVAHERLARARVQPGVAVALERPVRNGPDPAQDRAHLLLGGARAVEEPRPHEVLVRAPVSDVDLKEHRGGVIRGNLFFFHFLATHIATQML